MKYLVRKSTDQPELKPLKELKRQDFFRFFADKYTHPDLYYCLVELKGQRYIFDLRSLSLLSTTDSLEELLVEKVEAGTEIVFKF